MIFAILCGSFVVAGITEDLDFRPEVNKHVKKNSITTSMIFLGHRFS